MTRSLPSPETGSHVGGVDTPHPHAPLKEVGNGPDERMSVWWLGEVVNAWRGGEAGAWAKCQKCHLSASEPWTRDGEERLDRVAGSREEC